MIKGTYLLLAIALFANHWALSQGLNQENVFVEINTPNFLVNNQLSPEIIKLEYAFGVAKGTLKNEDGTDLNGFYHNTFIFSGYPITLINKKHRQLYLG